jgi:hypothetical protein
MCACVCVCACMCMCMCVFVFDYDESDRCLDVCMVVRMLLLLLSRLNSKVFVASASLERTYMDNHALLIPTLYFKEHLLERMLDIFLTRTCIY